MYIDIHTYICTLYLYSMHTHMCIICTHTCTHKSEPADRHECMSNTNSSIKKKKKKKKLNDALVDKGGKIQP